MTATHTELSRCPLPNASRADITVTIWEHDGEDGHRQGIELAHAACGWSASYTPDYPLTAFNVLLEVEHHLRPVQHIPRRGSDVETWIKRERDQIARPSFRWDALDDLLDDYREHADTGTPLDVEVSGPFAEVDR